jgi:hypothetical protein
VDDKYYIPLVLRRINNVSSSQLIIQSAESSGTTTVSVQFIKAAASPGSNYTKPNISLQPGASYYYDIEEEANLAAGWFGSAVVTAASSRNIAVVSNLFTLPDTVQTFNAFPESALSNVWFAPLFTSRLANALSTPISIQNLSGSTLNAGDIDVSCTPDATSSGLSSFVVSNPAAVAANETYIVNPVTDNSIPANWFGACRIQAPAGKNVAAFVQMRRPGQSSDAAAYEAIRGGGTNTTVQIPLMAKRLSVGFSTVATIQNLNISQAATVTLIYTANPASGFSGSTTVPNLSIPAGGSLIRNLRLPYNAGNAVTENLPDGWYGSLKVTSNRPIDAFVQLTTVGATSGDTLMAHGVFTQP